MSATNRGAVRSAKDFYPTPSWLTEAVVLVLQRYEPRRILEPAAGEGAIVRVLQAAFPNAVIDAGDITTGRDFLATPPPYKATYDLIITNPPYSLAQEFIERALELRASPRSVVAMLLRINYLGSQKRATWLRANFPAIYVTPRRPDFTGGGGDATEYAWMIWDGLPHSGGILETESNSTQRALL